ncbi:MAG TPA: indoleacetamide hydrolase [Methylomirabilota bacterium]
MSVVTCHSRRRRECGQHSPAREPPAGTSATPAPTVRAPTVVHRRRRRNQFSGLTAFERRHIIPPRFGSPTASLRARGEAHLIRRSTLHRRDFLRGLAATGAFAGGGWITAGCTRAASPPPAPPIDPLELTATQAIAAMRTGDLSAERYAERLIAQAGALSSLNALISMEAAKLLEAARAADVARAQGRRLGPLHGLPLLVKDNINTVALTTSAATRGLARNRPQRDAEVVAACIRAGAALFAKTNMHELAFGITSNNAAFGPVRNPYAPSLIAGGSSGGNGAAVAARIAPASLGTDTGGSTRIPAALCGIVGFRPTVGRYPGTFDAAHVTSVVPLSHTRDTPGPMARSVADVALLDAVIAGESTVLRPERLAGLRLGVARKNFFTNLDAALAVVVDNALRALQGAGAVLVEDDIADLAALNEAVSFPLVFYEANRDLPLYLAANAPGVSFRALIDAVASPDVKGVLQTLSGPGAVPASVYQAILSARRPALEEAYRNYFRRNGVAALVFPTTILPARPIGHDQTVELNGAQVPTFPTFIRNTDPGSNAGLPGLSIPIGLTRDGLPVGLELDGASGTDRRLLAIGLAIERAFGLLPAPPGVRR